MLPAVVGGREDSDELSLGEPFEAVHHALMCPDDHTQVVLLQEALHPVRPELHDVARLGRVPQVVREDPQLAVRVRGVRPQDVQHYLRLLVLHLVHHLQRPADVLDVFQGVQRRPDPPVQAEYLVLDEGCEGEPVEELVDPIEDGPLVFGVLLNLFCALVLEAEVDVDLAVLVVAPDEVDLLGVEALEGEQEADGFEGVAAAVHEVSQEDVVEVLNVLLFAVFVGSPIVGEEGHEVGELPVDVSEDLEGRLGLQDVGLADDDLLGQVAQIHDVLSPEADLECFCVHEVVGLQQHVEVFVGQVHLAAQGLGLQTHH